MRKTNKTPKRNPWVESKILASLLIVLVNVVFSALMVLVSRYMQIKVDVFIIGIASAVLLVLVLNILFVFGYIRNQRVFKKIVLTYGSILLLIGTVGFYYIYSANSKIDKIVKTDEVETVEYSLVSFEKDYTLETMDEMNVGYIESDATYESFVKEKVNSYSRTAATTGYKTAFDLLTASVDGDIQYAMLPKNYARLAESMPEGSEPFKNATSLVTFKTSLETEIKNVDVVKEPFTVLITGLNENLSDTIILATFNPVDMKVTMTSVPRDSYVPIACQGNRRDKINHSRAASRQCLMNSVENYLDVNIDFYFEADFYAVVKIVDALGGLEITSPITFAGSFPVEGEINEYKGVTVPEGTNLLDGEQVLTFARERGSFAGGDYQRQLNQQYVITEIAKKMLSTRNPNTLLSILDGAKDNIATNFPVNNISALMGYALQQSDASSESGMDFIRIVNYQILGGGHFLENGMWVMLPYESYVRNAHRLIDENLETEHELLNVYDFTFKFSHSYDFIEDNDMYEAHDYVLWYQGKLDTMSDDNDSATDVEEPVEKPVVPEEQPEENPSEETDNKVTVIDFSGMTNEEIQVWGDQHGITIHFSKKQVTNPADPNEPQFVDGQFWSQSEVAGTILDKGLSIEIVRVELTPGEPDPIPEEGAPQEKPSA